jgi:hypothetical protein
MVTVVPTLADAADECSDPRTAVDAVHRATALPLHGGRKGQVLKIEIVVVPVAECSLSVVFDGHVSFCPLVVSSGCAGASLVPVRSPVTSILGSHRGHL